MRLPNQTYPHKLTFVHNDAYPNPRCTLQHRKERKQKESERQSARCVGEDRITKQRRQQISQLDVNKCVKVKVESPFSRQLIGSSGRRGIPSSLADTFNNARNISLYHSYFESKIKFIFQAVCIFWTNIIKINHLLFSFSLSSLPSRSFIFPRSFSSSSSPQS